MNRKLKLIFEVVEAADGKFDPATVPYSPTPVIPLGVRTCSNTAEMH